MDEVTVQKCSKRKELSERKLIITQHSLHYISCFSEIDLNELSVAIDGK